MTQNPDMALALTLLDRSSILLPMNRATVETRATILRALTEGGSVRGVARMAGVSKGTVLRLLADAGEFCAGYHDLRLRNLPTVRVEADEIWSFCGAKQRAARSEGQGDLWTYCAIDADSKLVCSWLVGARNQENTDAFMADLKSRLTQRIQLSVDGYGAYITAVRRAFRFDEVDLAQIVKELGSTTEPGPERRYSPPVVVNVEKRRVIGRPDMDLVSTSYIERLNLDTRQKCKRFARLTSAHSRKAENHAHAVALNFFAHNFIRVHGTLSKKAGRKTTPAMAAGLTDRPWTVNDLVALMDPETVTVK
jgi:IS1 family transposase